jgi:hypothetical protein
MMDAVTNAPEDGQLPEECPTQQPQTLGKTLSMSIQQDADPEYQIETVLQSDTVGISDDDGSDGNLFSRNQDFATEPDPPVQTESSKEYCNNGTGENSTECSHHTATGPPFVFPEGYEDSVISMSEQPVNDLTIALATWTTLFSVSTAAYKALAEILKSVEDLNTLKTLPLSISTLNDRLNHQLPIPRLMSKTIPLDVAKLSNTDKDHGRIYLFDQRESVKDTIENTALRSVMHFGWGEISDNRSELWHGSAWWESMRASAVGCAQHESWPRYENGEPILFSDFVTFGNNRLGRIRGMAIDRRSNSTTNNKLVAIIEQLFRSVELPETVRPKSLGPDNLVLIENPVLYVDVSCIHTRMEIFLEGPPLRCPADDSSEPRTVCRQNAQAAAATASAIESLRHTTTRTTETPDLLVPIPLNRVEYILDLEKPENNRSIRLRHPLRGELEIITFGRDHIIQCFLLNPLPVVTLPLVFFTDGFGAYRNSYRSLLAVYTISANLPEQERRRLHNLKLLTIGPFGSSLPDVIRALAPAGKALDRGMILDLKIGDHIVQSYVCAYQFMHTSDFPQQNDSSGTLRQNATYGCRLCLINKEYRDDLTYNVCLHGRYQLEMEQARATVSSIAKTRRAELLGRLGLAEEVSPWTIISPAINQFEIFALDVCHSEGSGRPQKLTCLLPPLANTIAGMCGIINSLVKDWLLTEKAGIAAYISSFRTLVLPSGWPRFQNPITHHKSYGFAEKLRLSLMQPFVTGAIVCSRVTYSICRYDSNNRSRRGYSYISKNGLAACYHYYR